MIDHRKHSENISKQSLADGIFENVRKHTFCTISILCAGLVQYKMRMTEQLHFILQADTYMNTGTQVADLNVTFSCRKIYMFNIAKGIKPISTR